MIACEWYAAHGLRRLYALPIAYQDSVVGVLVLHGRAALRFPDRRALDTPAQRD